MTHLGSFGAPVEEPEDVTFDFCGERFRANAGLSELDYVDFIETAGAVDIEGPDAVRLVKQFARMCIHPEDFDTLWATAKAHRQGVSEIFRLLKRIVEAVSDRPTERLSSSAATPTTDATSSAVVSSALAQRLAGRPDLQLVVQRSAEARAAAAG